MKEKNEKEDVSLWTILVTLILTLSFLFGMIYFVSMEKTMVLDGEVEYIKYTDNDFYIIKMVNSKPVKCFASRGGLFGGENYIDFTGERLRIGLYKQTPFGIDGSDYWMVKYVHNVYGKEVNS